MQDDHFATYIDLLRDHGLLRTDTDRATQVYALEAAGAGFYFTEQFLPPDPMLPLERKAAVLAGILRRAFEPPEDPDVETLCAVAPRAVELFDLMRTGCPPQAPDPTSPVREEP